MKMFVRKRRKDNRGLSLIEMVCAIAIFSVVTAAVGSVMVVSANNYNRGNVETDLQQEAQLTTNLLSNLIIDASSITPNDAGDTLTIVKDGVTYIVQRGTGEDANKLFYTEQSAGGTDSNILADYVTNFQVKREAGSKNVEVILGFEKNGNTFETSYNVTPRNETPGATTAPGTIFVEVENRVVLEPNESYTLPATVRGATATVVWSIDSSCPPNDPATTIDPATGTVVIANGETAEQIKFIATATTSTGATTSNTVTVFVRRANSIVLTATQGDINAPKAGAEYTIVANVNGSNFRQMSAINGAYNDGYYEGAEFYEITYEGCDSSYLTATPVKIEGQKNSYIHFVLSRDLPDGASITIKARSKHATTTSNKANTPYDLGLIEKIVIKTPKIIKITGLQRTGKVNLSIDEDMLPEEFFGYVTHPERWENGVLIPEYTVYEGTYDVDTVKLYFLSQVDPAYPSGGVDGYTRAIDYTVTSKWSQYGSYINLTHVGGDETYLNWIGTLSPQRTGGNTEQFAYSSPYFEAYNDWSGWWCDINEVVVKYTFKLANGESVEVVGSADLEEVAIEYRNSVEETNWSNAEKVFLTKEDCVGGTYTHRAYFRFIQGWDKDATAGDWKPYYFHKLNRFVGVVHDGKIDGGANIRNDIAATQSSVDAMGNSYVEFQVREDQIVAGQTVQEIFEYNPYFATTACPTGTTPDLLNKIDGCEGIIKFCFKEPNVFDYPSKPKITYCPTLTDLGSSDTAAIYYIDDDTRYVVQQAQAEYQIKDATTGTWSSQLKFKWDSRNGKTGWFYE